MPKKAKKQKLHWEGRVLVCSYPSIGKEFRVDTAKYGAEIDEEARDHGYKQKFGDAGSGQTAIEKYAEVQAIHASLLNGEWERTATPDLTPLICEAISRIQRKPLEKVTQAAEKAGAEKVKEWGANAKVKAEILKIRAERAAKAAKDAEEELDIDLE